MRRQSRGNSQFEPTAELRMAVAMADEVAAAKQSLGSMNHPYSLLGLRYEDLVFLVGSQMGRFVQLMSCTSHLQTILVHLWAASPTIVYDCVCSTCQN